MSRIVFESQTSVQVQLLRISFSSSRRKTQLYFSVAHDHFFLFSYYSRSWNASVHSVILKLVGSKCDACTHEEAGISLKFWL
jgi:hypothetical protein